MKKKVFLVSCVVKFIFSRKKALGQDLVEFALVFPLLLLFLFGSLDLGRAFFSYIAITNAAREGARYGISYNIKDNSTGKFICATNYIKNAAVLEAADSGIVISADQVNVTCPVGVIASGDSILVTVNYAFRPLLSFVAGGSTINMGRTIEMSILWGG